MIGIADIDVYQSTHLARFTTAEDARATFESWHELVDTVLSAHGAELWNRSGDGIIYTFKTLRRAVDGCVELLEEMGAFNQGPSNRLGSPIYVRIGLVATDQDSILDVPSERRGRNAYPDVGRAGHLQKHCPVGALAISKEVYELIGVRNQMFRPPSSEILRRDEGFICSSRQSMPQARRLLEGLTPRQEAIIPPISRLNWLQLVPEAGTGLRELRTVLSEPGLVILGETNRGQQSKVRGAATSDVVGVVEIMSSVKGNTDTVVAIDQWEDTRDLADSRTAIIIGSGIVNTYAFAINDLIEPVRFDKHSGQVFDRIIATSGGIDGRPRQWAYGEHDLVGEHCGLVVICKSPFSIGHALLWIAGIGGTDTQAAAQFVADLVRDSDGTLRRAGIPGSFQPIGCVVGSRTRRSNLGVEDYYRRWRIRDYELVWSIDAGGHYIEPVPERAFDA